VECIEAAEVLSTRAVDVPEATLDHELGSSYGIFSGQPVATARLLFSPRQAPWVSIEQWHPDQVGQMTESGHYLLELPYSQSQELVMDILRYGPDFEVLAPLELRQSVAERLRAAADLYK
jgi:predicted DNA-binding transcriptional regulator YafY